MDMGGDGASDVMGNSEVGRLVELGWWYDLTL